MQDEEAAGQEDASQEETLKHFSKIVEAAKALGWDLAVPQGTTVNGAIVGAGEYVDRILSSIPADVIRKARERLKEAIASVGDGRMSITELDALLEEVLGEEING